MRWRPISAGVLSDKGFAPKDTQRRCGPMELPQSTAKVGPDPPWWGWGYIGPGPCSFGEQAQPYDLLPPRPRGEGSSAPSQPEHVKHGGLTHLLEFRRIDEPGF